MINFILIIIIILIILKIRSSQENYHMNLWFHTKLKEIYILEHQDTQWELDKHRQHWIISTINQPIKFVEEVIPHMKPLITQIPLQLSYQYLAKKFNNYVIQDAGYTTETGYYVDYNQIIISRMFYLCEINHLFKLMKIIVTITYHNFVNNCFPDTTLKYTITY